MKSRLASLALGIVSLGTLASGPARADLAPNPEPEKKDGGCSLAIDGPDAAVLLGALSVVTVAARRRARA